MKAFRITAKNQYIQSVQLEQGEYTLSGYIYPETFTSTHYIRFTDGFVNKEVPIFYANNQEWNYFAVTFTLPNKMTSVDLYSPMQTVNSPVRLLALMLEQGNNASTHRPSDLDFDEEMGDLGENIIEMSTDIVQTKASVAILATKTTQLEGDVSDVEASISQMDASITVMADEIASKVSQTDFNALGDRVSTSESDITLLSNQITSKVSQTDYDANNTIINSYISTVDQKADSINITVDDLLDDLEATGINIDLKEIVVTAPTFKVKQPNGTPIAVFNENFLLDDYANMRIKSLRTPLQVLTPSFSGGTYTINWDTHNNIILTGLSQDGSITLPQGEKYNGLQLIIVWDAFWRGNSSAPSKIIDLKPYGTGKFYVNQFDKLDYMRLYTQCRQVVKLVGVWNSTDSILDWVVEDVVDYSGKKTEIKAGDLLCSGAVDVNGNITIHTNNYIGSITASKDASNNYFVKPASILRYDKNLSTETYYPSTYSELIMNVNSTYVAVVDSDIENYSPYITRFKVRLYTPGASTNTTGSFRFEIRAMKDINQRFF